MSGKRQNIQLVSAFAEEVSGESPKGLGEGTEALTASFQACPGRIECGPDPSTRPGMSAWDHLRPLARRFVPELHSAVHLWGIEIGKLSGYRSFSD